MDESIYRKKSMDRITSPEELGDYLHVTNPGIWVILTAVIILMLGVFVWACTGTLETKSPASYTRTWSFIRRYSEGIRIRKRSIFICARPALRWRTEDGAGARLPIPCLFGI